MLVNEDKSKELSVRQRLSMFLESRKMRKTTERFVILERIYASSAHVDVATLHQAMLAEGFQVSRATVYNTLDLLVEAGLVRCISLGDGATRYERVVQANNHYHLICTRCGKVKEMKAQEVVGTLLARKPRSFEPQYYTLYIYGVCSRCAKAEKATAKEKK